MNHINKLQQTVDAQAAQIAQITERTAEFRAHLASAKFNHDASDGLRTDLIGTADVARWLAYINWEV